VLLILVLLLLFVAGRKKVFQIEGVNLLCPKFSITRNASEGKVNFRKQAGFVLLRPVTTFNTTGLTWHSSLHCSSDCLLLEICYRTRAQAYSVSTRLSPIIIIWLGIVNSTNCIQVGTSHIHTVSHSIQHCYNGALALACCRVCFSFFTSVPSSSLLPLHDDHHRISFI